MIGKVDTILNCPPKFGSASEARADGSVETERDEAAALVAPIYVSVIALSDLTARTLLPLRRGEQCDKCERVCAKRVC